MAEQLKLDYDDMMQKAEILHKQDPSVTIPKVVVPGESFIVIILYSSYIVNIILSYYILQSNPVLAIVLICPTARRACNACCPYFGRGTALTIPWLMAFCLALCTSQLEA